MRVDAGFLSFNPLTIDPIFGLQSIGQDSNKSSSRRSGGSLFDNGHNDDNDDDLFVNFDPLQPNSRKNKNDNNNNNNNNNKDNNNDIDNDNNDQSNRKNDDYKNINDVVITNEKKSTIKNVMPKSTKSLFEDDDDDIFGEKILKNPKVSSEDNKLNLINKSKQLTKSKGLFDD